MQLNVKTVLFQTIQFSIITQFSSIWPVDRALSGATTPGQSGPGKDSIEGVLCIYMCVCVCVRECVYKYDLALNNPQKLICHKTQPNQTKPLEYSKNT